jgi:microcystin-dependent protein
LTQALAAGSLAVGESGLQILHYGTGEARLSGKLRTDGIVRALGGVYAGAFTTTQRDAIAAGSRPYGLIVLNTTTNRMEWNAGTDGSPSWQPIALDGGGSLPVVAVPAGVGPLPWMGATAPDGWLLCDGSAVSRTTYADLFAVIGETNGPGNGTTTFNLPDMRGRSPVGKNATTFSALGAKGGEETHQLTVPEMPGHDHGGVTSYASAGTPAGVVTVDGSGTLTTGTESADHTHSGTTGNQSASHTHSGSSLTAALAGAHQHTISVFTGTGEDDAGNGGVTLEGSAVTSSAGDHTHAVTGSTGTQSASHTHSFTTGGKSATHTHSVASHAHTASFAGTPLGTHQHAVAAQGGDGAHNNMPPYLVTNFIIKH